jgi:hypothetical protein
MHSMSLFTRIFSIKGNVTEVGLISAVPVLPE